MQHSAALSAFLATAALGLATNAHAQTPLTTIRIASGLSDPVGAVAIPGDDRVFIVEQTSAQIKILEGGAVLGTPFLTVSGVLTGGERGLLGLAFHPEYQSNGYFFVNYTRSPDGATVVARYQVSAGDPNVANAASATTVLTQSQPFSNHNGGNLVFGPDGMLYIALGDGGSGNDPQCRAQKLDTWLGKMLRIDVDALPYTVPADNPYIGTVGALPEIWATGLRNPWRYSFDDATGDLYIGDVGQDAREEVDWVPAGAAAVNYGWKVMEGNKCNSSGNCPVGTPACNSPVFTDPVHEYVHSFTSPICTVVGGFVYRGCGIPDLDGTYFFADYCSDDIWSMQIVGGVKTNFMDRTAELDPPGALAITSITSFGQDGNGELLIVDYGNGVNGQGELYRVVPSGSAGTDCDVNGLVDACEIAKDPVKDLSFDGVLDVCQGLSADVASLSLSAGGVQHLDIHMGAGHAGEIALTLGSASGTVPGLSADGVPVPLNFDAYLVLSLTQVNTIPLVHSFAFLDGAGNGFTDFTIPAGTDGSLAGLQLDHAAITFVGIVTGATNAVHVTLDP
jgi:glucose/arabinose dehydrogenase